MQQRIIYLHYLLIGISAIFLAGSCGKEIIDYRVRGIFIYKNMTQHKIELVEKGKTLFSGDSVILNFDAGT